MAIKIKGVDKREKDGVEGIYATAADMGFKSLTSSTNKLELSALKGKGLKDPATGEFINTVMYPEGVKEVTKKNKDGKDITFNIGKDKTLDKLNYTKEYRYDFKNKKSVKLEQPIDLFKVGSTVEGLLQLSFPSYIVDGKLEYTPNKDNKEVKVKNKFIELRIPKDYDAFIRLNYENISAIVSNISIDYDAKLKEAKMADVDKPEATHFVEKPQAVKNLGRLYALLESYPNILPVLPAYVVALPIIQEAYIKGKKLENVINIDNQLEFVKIFDFKDKVNYPVFERVEAIVKGNAPSKKKLLDLKANINEELGKYDITFNDIKAEYENAKSALDEMKKLPVYEVKKGSATEEAVSAEDLGEVYGLEGHEKEVEHTAGLDNVEHEKTATEQLEEDNEVMGEIFDLDEVEAVEHTM